MDQQGLGETGHAHQEAVASREQPDERLLDHVLLADDDLAQLGGDPLSSLVQAVGELGVVGVVRFRRR